MEHSNSANDGDVDDDSDDGGKQQHSVIVRKGSSLPQSWSSRYMREV